MPQLINHLEVDPGDSASPDWGMVAIYSCSASCPPQAGGNGGAYAEEFVWVQPPQ
jgi:hypothetical protein